MFKKTLLVLLLSLALLALAACGGGDAETPAETNPEAEAIGNAEDTWPYERLHIWDIRLRQG